tara:strand:+ start:189 stop:551 length:363 start_codon:yes stop_codon:yes gene_type:complete
MSREHFIESHLEDKVNELIYEEDLSEEDAYIKARSIYDGEVNLMEEQAKKRYDEENQPKIHNLETNFTTSIYSSAILVNKITDYLESNANSSSQAHEVNIFCIEMMDQIVDWRKEIDNGK